jgi:sugar transferase (PEP-CTERM/EpsH1 system associated)
MSMVRLIKNLDPERYEPIGVCLEDEGELTVELRALGIEVILLHKRPGLDFRLFLKLLRLIRDRRIGIVHAYSPSAMLYGAVAARVANVPVVIGSVSAFDCTIGDLKPAVYTMIDRSATIKNRLRNKIAACFVNKIVAISAKLGDNFCRFNGISMRKLQVIPYGINTREYVKTALKSDKQRREVGLNAEDLVVGTVGRLIPEKDIGTLLRAFKSVTDIFSNAKLVIVGDGPLKLDLKDIVRELKISDKVFFLGYRNDIPDIIGILDLFVLSSVFESFGIVLLEAMAAQKPVVATNIGGIPDIVADGVSGILVPPHDPGSLSKAIIEILNDKSRAAAMGLEGCKIAQNFDTDKMAAGYQGLYEALLSKKGDHQKINIMLVVLKLDFGGAENLVINIAQKLSRNRYRLSICSLENPTSFADCLKDSGIRLISLDKKKGFDFLLPLRLAWIMRKEQVHISHTHNRCALMYGTLAAKLAGVPVVINTRHGSGVKVRYKFLWKANDKIVAVCEHARNVFLENSGIDPKKVKTILNGIDIHKYKKTEDTLSIRRKFGIGNSEWLVGTVGRLAHEKDYLTLLKSFMNVLQEIPFCRLVMVGDGELRTKLENDVKTLGIEKKVSLIGFQHNIVEIMSVFDVFVLSSITEGLPLVIMEAMAVKAPVVATNVGGTPEVVVDGETGILVPPKDPQKMAEAIITILRNSNLAKKMGEAGRKKIEEKFNLDRMVREYEAVYEECFVKKSER